MATEKFTSESGIDYEINCADWETVLQLKNAVWQCIKNSDIEKEQIDSLILFLTGTHPAKKKATATTFDEKNILNSLKQKDMHFESLINGIKNAFIELDTSSEIYTVLWKCLSRCTYNGERITKSIFEQEEAREDFYEIMIACILKNIRPFIKSLILQLKSLNNMITQNIQKLSAKLG